MSLNNKQMRLVWVIKRELGWDEDIFRTVLSEHCGVKSTKELDSRGLEKYVAHAEVCGFKSRTPPGRARWEPPRMGPGMASDAQVRKIIALWYSLTGYYVEGREMKALSAFLLKTCGVSRLEWLTPAKAHNTIEAIKDIAKRRAA